MAGKMKKFRFFFLISLFTLCLFFSPSSSSGADEEKGPGKEKISQKSRTQKDGEKAREEIKEMKQGVREVGREMKNAFKEFPAQAGKEFKKTGKALKETGRELKEGTKEAVEDLKKFFTK